MLKPALFAALIGAVSLHPAFANEAKPAGAAASPAPVEAKAAADKASPASGEAKAEGDKAKPASVAAKSPGGKASVSPDQAKRSAGKARPAAGEAKPAGGETSAASVEAKPAAEAKPSAEAKPAAGAKAKPIAGEASAFRVDRKRARRKATRASDEAQLVDGEAKLASAGTKSGGGLEALIAMHAKANNVPEDLVHRVVQRESRYNPRAVGRGGAMGLMQIKTATARSLGYSGSPAGLLDADTNLTYAVRYLAGAYKVANGDHSRAVGFYARGYYYDAKRKGILPALKAQPLVLEAKATAPDAAKTASARSSLFVPALTPYTSLDSTK